MDHFGLMSFEAEQQGQALRPGDIVINHEHLAAPRSGASLAGLDTVLSGIACRRRGLLNGWLYRFPHREPDAELASLAQAFACRLNRSAVHFDQASHQGQAEAQASLRAVKRTVDLGE